MKKRLVIPTWLAFIFLKPILHKNHPLKNKKLTLEEWSDGATFLTIVLF